MEYKESDIVVVDKQQEFSAISDLSSATSNRKTSGKYSRDDIESYLTNPYKNDSKLRAVSDWFYTTNGIYRNIINAYANLPTLDNIILPTQKTLEKSNDKSYTQYYDKVFVYKNALNIKLLGRRILKSVAKYGGYVGYERNEGGEIYIQDLNLDYCRIKYRIGNDYQIEFNFKYFDKFFQKEDLDLAWEVYPKEFKKLYNRYKTDKKSKSPEWQMIDVKSTICVMADEDEPYFIPIYTGMFDSLLSNEEYKDLVMTGQKLAISKLLVQKVPLNQDGGLLIQPDIVREFHKELVNIKPEGSNAITTPLEITDVSFKNQSQEKEDLLGKAESNVFLQSGYTKLIFDDGGGLVGLNANIEFNTASINSIIEKIEDVFSRRFKRIVNSKNYEFKLKIFKTTTLNVQENFDRMYKLLEIGGAIQPLFSLIGFDVESYTTLLSLENELKLKDLLVVPQSMHTSSNDGAGAPIKKDGDLTESGARTRTDGSNEE